jgi:hypothetical protein
MGITRSPTVRFALRGGGQGADQVPDLARQLQSNLDLSGSEGLVGKKGHDEGEADDSLIDDHDDDDDDDDEVTEEKIAIGAVFPHDISPALFFSRDILPRALCMPIQPMLHATIGDDGNPYSMRET